jgi:hypothetical protein
MPPTTNPECFSPARPVRRGQPTGTALTHDAPRTSGERLLAVAELLSAAGAAERSARDPR